MLLSEGQLLLVGMCGFGIDCEVCVICKCQCLPLAFFCDAAATRVAGMKNFMRFTRCRLGGASDSEPGISQPWEPSQREIREKYIPMIEKQDAIILAYNTAETVFIPEIKREALLLTTDGSREMQYVTLVL